MMKRRPKRHSFFKGRIGLHAILRSADIGEGDQVLLPGYTCVVVPNAIKYVGASPIYLDIEAATYNLDCNKLEIDVGTTWDPNTTRAIIAQHTYGIPCDMDRIRAFADRYDLIVIEDSCHALGATWSGIPTGQLGDAAFFSCQWSKPITTGLGGWIEMQSAALQSSFDQIAGDYTQPSLVEAFRLELQRVAFALLNRPDLFWTIQGIYRHLSKVGLTIGSSTAKELASELPRGYMKRMHSIQRRQLDRLLRDSAISISLRNQNTTIIERTLREFRLPTVVIPDKCRPVFLHYPILVENKCETLAQARKNRIQLSDWFLSPVHPNLERWELAGYTRGSCPVAEYISRHIVSIPTGSRVSSKDIRRTIQFLASHAISTPP